MNRSAPPYLPRTAWTARGAVCLLYRLLSRHNIWKATRLSSSVAGLWLRTNAGIGQQLTGTKQSPMDKKEVQNVELEEVLISSRATDEDLEAGLLNSSSHAVDSLGQPVQKQRSSVKRNVSELGQRVRESFKGQTETPAPIPLKPSLPSPPKSAMKKQAGALLYLDR